MKKRLLSAIMAFAMAGVLFTGCSSKQEDAPAASDDAQATSSEEATDEDALNVAILLNGTLGDKAFYDSAANGADMIETQLGCNTKVVEMTYDETKWEPTLLDFSEDPDYDIIVVGTWQMSEKLQAIAPQYPDKKYIIFDSTVDYEQEGVENVYSIEYKQNECSYLAGALAAMTTETGTIGFVGGMENTVINDFMVGYIQGAKDTNPDIKVLTAFVGNFSDSARAKELTIAQINQNADIIYQAASTAGLGVIDGCLEKDKLCIGVDSDQAEALLENDPDKANVILTSALKRVDISILQAMEKELDGSLEYGQRVVMGIAEGCVGLAKNDIYTSKVAEETQTTIDELEQKIQNGEIDIDTAFGKTTEEIQAVRDSVK